MALLRETDPIGDKRHGKLNPAEAFLLAFVERTLDVIVTELATALLAEKGIVAATQSLSRWLIPRVYGGALYYGIQISTLKGIQILPLSSPAHSSSTDVTGIVEDSLELGALVGHRFLEGDCGDRLASPRGNGGRHARSRYAGRDCSAQLSL
jgi:hypothetical protein